MNKIVRLSWANIKKHKLESIALMILVMLCMMLCALALGGIIGLKNIFPNMMKNTGSYENYVLITEKDFDDKFIDILKEDDRVEDCARSEALYSMSTNYLNALGKEQSMYMCFITQENEARIQHSPMETKLSDSEIAAMEHPIYMPYSVRDSMNYKEGDKFEMIYGTRKFTFTVAGFYDTALFDTPNSILKMIVSESDYHVLEAILDKYVVLGFNDFKGKGGTELFNDLLKEFTDYSGKDISCSALGITYEGLKMGVTYTADLLLKFLIVMSAVIIVCVAVMIRFRIAGDISEQIVSIGVLEALGYKSTDITLSYVLEYILISLAGIILGTGLSLLVTPALISVGEIVSGHPSGSSVSLMPIAVTMAVILAFVAFISFIRAFKVRNYPPVRAFRKGQGDHRFGKEHFPLRKTKKSVHLRLAMKGFLKNFKQNLGLTLCVTISTITIVVCFVMFNFFSGDMNAIAVSAGVELSDLRVELMNTSDAYAFAEELVEIPEIRKAVPTSGFTTYLTAPDYNNDLMIPVALDDFSEAENIFPSEGRFPEHDNEVMITNMYAKLCKLKTGDSITLDNVNVRRKYVITGLVTSATNGGMNLYITMDGMKRIVPTYKPDTIEIYLNEGVDADEIRYSLTEKYGRSVADVAQDRSDSESYEERIRNEAERKIAEIMANYGVTHVEYAIQSGDTVIKGNSDGFIIKSIMNVRSIMETQLGAISIGIAVLTTLFMIISVFVVMIILFILMESTIRKQRKEFGIMKGIGYTSRELMLQLAFRIMPAALFSVAAGTAVGVSLLKLLTSYIGKVSVNMPVVIILDVILLMFCFGCAYIGARKIKKISVCELMTE